MITKEMVHDAMQKYGAFSEGLPIGEKSVSTKSLRFFLNHRKSITYLRAKSPTEYSNRQITCILSIVSETIHTRFSEMKQV